MRVRLLLFAACAAACVAADWPQWRGPDRGGVSSETGLLKQWPKDGPELAWSFENAGTGYGSFAVVGGRAYVLGARPVDADKRVEQLIALDDKGKERWKADIGPMWDFEGNQWSGGPNSTPTVDGDRVFALGSQGILVCVKTADGSEVWRKDLPKEFGAEVSSGGFGPEKRGWGFSWSPLVDGDKLICTPGGSKGLFIAFDKMSGDVLWRSTGLDRRLHLLLAGRGRDRRRPSVHRVGANRRRRRLGEGRLDAVGTPPRGGVSRHRRSDAGGQGQPYLHQRLEGRR